MQMTLEPSGMRFTFDPEEGGRPTALTVRDRCGITVHFVFPDVEAWHQFQEIVADPHGAAARADALGKLILPGDASDPRGGL